MTKVLFCLSLIFGLLVLNTVPSFAMEFTISPEMIGGLGDLGYGLIGGAEFDFNGTDYVINDYDNLSEALKAQAAEQKAREFLQAYCMARGIPIPNIDPDLPATTGKEFYKSMYFDSANRTVWNNYKLGRTTIEQQEALRFPISPQAFNDWTGYSNFWYEKYIDQFMVEEEPDIPTPNAPIEFQPIIDVINFPQFSVWNDYHINYSDLNGSLIGVSGPNYDPSEGYFFNLDGIVYNNTQYSFKCLLVDTLNVYINYDEVTHQYTVHCPGLSGCVIKSDANKNVIGAYSQDNRPFLYNIADTYKYSQSTAHINTSYTDIIGHYGTIENALNGIKGLFAYVNIYVNGELWAYVGSIDDAPANPTIPSFPDVIGGNEDDPFPAYDIVFPNTSDYEGTFDITSLFDALKEAIIGASDSDDSTDSTLTREKVTDTYKDKVGEAVGEAVKTIDDVMEDSFPAQGTLNYPNLPPIPMIPLDNAFAGTTILSELIDACQQILPSPLALAFWGMIFILFIIGLIRILHK